RSLVPADIVARAEAFEQPYHQFFRLKEYHDASLKNNGGRLVSQWLEQLDTSDIAKQCELLARLGSVPAYHAHDYLEQILSGRTVQSSGGAVTSFGSNMASQYDPGTLPSDLIQSKDPNIVMLTLRALGRTGFTAEHAHLLIDKLDDENQAVRQYAVLALAELTGVYLGPDKAPWEIWLNQYQAYRSELNGKGHFQLFASLCDVFRKHSPSRETTERIMAAWQGGSDGGARFRRRVSGEQAEALTHFFASIKIDGEHPVKYGHCPGYWPTDMFSDKGYRNQNLKFQFKRTCQWGEKTLEPGRDYMLPALFRDGHQGKWEIVDLKLDDIQEIESSK
ncbi:MAG: HEAT repeat domain-containing protein, partial [Planctomycetes bacterium]|nr:HEAT repeat domain-containing protein [Planctomycetota bacterium]